MSSQEVGTDLCLIRIEGWFYRDKETCLASASVFMHFLAKIPVLQYLC